MEFLQTQRLVFRAMEPGDAARVAAYRSDADVSRYVPWSAPYAEERARELVEKMRGRTIEACGDGLVMIVERRSDQAVVGEAMVKREGEDDRSWVMGYALAREHHGAGYGTEVSRGLLAELLGRRGKHRVAAFCDARNTASRRVLEKSGMRLEGVLVEGVWCKGEWVNECQYAMLGREWGGG